MLKLEKWDKIWIISVANNLDPEKLESYGIQSFKRIMQDHLGFELIFGKNILLPIQWTNPQKRAQDFNNFLKDDSIKMIWPIGWWAFTNEILPFIDWETLKNNPKIICGYSDITALNNAIYAKTWIVSFSGPTPGSFSPSRFANLENFLYFKKMIIDNEDVELVSNSQYFDYTADKEIYPDQIIDDGGLQVVKRWKWEWIIIWGNISTFALLFGTEFMPDLENKVLFLEECGESSIWTIRRQLMWLKQQKKFDKIAGVVFGRINQECLKDYDITWEETVQDFSKDINAPVLMNAQFGHISPIQTFPIWGKMSIDTKIEKYFIQR